MSCPHGPEEFVTWKSGQRHCKACNRDRMNAKYADAEHRASISARRASLRTIKLSNQTERDRQRAYQLFRNYGITAEAWNTIFELQGSRCAICDATEPGACWWQTDHNKVTNTIRGILCSACNLMLGKARDDMNILRKAATYVEWDGLVGSVGSEITSVEVA